jgi:hypothetical protein
MEVDLLTMSEAGRRYTVALQTIRSWTSDGSLDRYYWRSGARRRGPRVSESQVRALLGEIVNESGVSFRLNRPRRGSVEITVAHGETKRAIALHDALIELAVSHPDGLLILTAHRAGKITPNDKGAWSFSEATARDLELAGVADSPVWVGAIANRY